jgi:endonuclease III
MYVCIYYIAFYPNYYALVYTMLSPQTRDQQTALAFDNLVALVAPEPLTALSLLAYADADEAGGIEAACAPVSFYSVKAKNIILASQRCVSEFDNDIPTDIDALLSFKGVGPKIAYLTFTIAYGITLGTYVHTYIHTYTYITYIHTHIHTYIHTYCICTLNTPNIISNRYMRRHTRAPHQQPTGVGGYLGGEK